MSVVISSLKHVRYASQKSYMFLTYPTNTAWIYRGQPHCDKEQSALQCNIPLNKEISKTLNSFQKFPKNNERLLLGNERLLLGNERLLLGNERLLLGNERLLLGNERLLLGIIGVFGFFGLSFFVAGGFSDSVGRGGPVGVFKNI